MKNLGLLFGANLLLDTENDEVAKAAERHLEQMNKDSRELARIKTEKEMESL